MKKIPRNTLRDCLIGVGMFVAALLAVLSSGYHGLSLIIAVPYVLIVGSVPWILYNLIAHLVGWQKSHVLDLLRHWFNLIINNAS